MRRAYVSALAALAALAIAGCASAPQATGRAAVPLDHLPALAGDYFALDSRESGHRYHIYVRYPEGYAERPAQRYPAVYLLDGDSLYPYLAPHHLFLTYDDKLPEAILVGIAYGSFAPPVNRRDHDFGDGSAAFQRFLRVELIPEIERRTRADPQRRILVGQSRGGGFALYSALTDPALFWARIASNPSFPVHRDLLLGESPQTTVGVLSRLVVVSGTNDRPQIRAGTLEFLQRWQQRPGPWLLKSIELPGGTHAADMPNAYRQAMNWLLAAPRAD